MVDGRERPQKDGGAVVLGRDVGWGRGRDRRVRRNGNGPFSILLVSLRGNVVAYAWGGRVCWRSCDC